MLEVNGIVKTVATYCRCKKHNNSSSGLDFLEKITNNLRKNLLWRIMGVYQLNGSTMKEAPLAKLCDRPKIQDHLSLGTASLFPAISMKKLA